jgi:Zn-dependent peptidase ImmA (M78 family)
MNKLYDIVKGENIHLLYTNLLSNTHNKLYGLYFYDEDHGPSILLEKTLDKPECKRLHKCVLAHELGHYFTSPRANILHASTGYWIMESQDEYRATVWATNLLMPDDKFNQAIADGCQSVYDLSEYFHVTEWLVYRKLGIIKAKYREMGVKLRSRDYFNMKLV